MRRRLLFTLAGTVALSLSLNGCGGKPQAIFLNPDDAGVRNARVIKDHPVWIPTGDPKAPFVLGKGDVPVGAVMGAAKGSTKTEAEAKTLEHYGK